MKEDDVEDIFKDFEHKVSGKKGSTESERKETHSKQEEKKGFLKKLMKKDKDKKKEVSEEERMKREYQEEKQALKEKHKKEMMILQERQYKEMLKHGKIPNKKIANVERIVYLLIIFILLIFIIFDFSFYQGKDKEQIEIEQQNVVAVNETEEKNKTAEVIEEKVEEKPKEEVKVEEPAEELKLSGQIILSLDKVDYEVVEEENDLGYITKVSFTISNGKNKLLKPVVNVFAYDDKLDESWQVRSRGTYKNDIGIKAGSSAVGTIELAPKTFRNLAIQKTVRIELNDTQEGFITSQSQTITFS